MARRIRCCARSNEGTFLLVSLPPPKGHIRLALSIIVALLVIFFVMVPFANVQLPQLGTLYLVILTITMVSDLITSALLFSQFFVAGRTALFALAISYLFTGLLTIGFYAAFSGRVFSDRAARRRAAKRGIDYCCL